MSLGASAAPSHKSGSLGGSAYPAKPSVGTITPFVGMRSSCGNQVRSTIQSVCFPQTLRVAQHPCAFATPHHAPHLPHRTHHTNLGHRPGKLSPRSTSLMLIWRSRCLSTPQGQAPVHLGGGSIPGPACAFTGHALHHSSDSHNYTRSISQMLTGSPQVCRCSRLCRQYPSGALGPRCASKQRRRGSVPKPPDPVLTRPARVRQSHACFDTGASPGGVRPRCHWPCRVTVVLNTSAQRAAPCRQVGR